MMQMSFASQRSKLCALGLSLATVCWAPQSLAAEVDEARLRAIRQAMVDAAVETTTHVQATSWMDSQGALREYNRFTSEIRMRDVRLLESGSPEDKAQAKARLTPVRDAVAVPAQIEAVRPESCPKPAAKTALRHVMSTSVVLAPGLAPAERYAAQQVGRAAMASLMGRSARSSYWRTVSEASSSRMYDRQLQGFGLEHVSWQLQLQVESAGASGWVQETPALTLRWQVRPRPQQHAWLEQTDFVPPARQAVNAATPRIDVDMAQAIARSVDALVQALDQRLACDPQALSLQNEEGRLVLSAGDMSGLRVGDRVLLTDSRHLPQHVLEPQALDAAVLAEVKSVSAYRAELKQVAGRKQKFNSSWVAWPYTY
ncbi:MAG: hypothetical protein RLZZ24_544 [Pseudomonadota bacterium]